MLYILQELGMVCICLSQFEVWFSATSVGDSSNSCRGELGIPLRGTSIC